MNATDPKQIEPDWAEVDRIIENSLREDAPGGDVTTNVLFSPEETGTGIFRSKSPGVLAGLKVAQRVFQKLDDRVHFSAMQEDGTHLAAHTVIAEVNCRTRALLTGERIALNLMQRMSGIATLTAQYVDAVKGLPTLILDTRKTAPGLRVLDKYAVRLGGGTNHRLTLSDLAMIKDNHIRLAGGVWAAVRRIRAQAPAGLRIEVECANLDQVHEAIEAGADIIMLDNMPTSMMREAVHFINKRAQTEASGNIGLETVRAAAETGVDFISIGRLTHSAPALDISMKIA
ncbi:MAG: carboxylating nicotinate-nucleotide diphosphorylase [Kiritimatiellae bacterium]|nr:carboxylating nicotinate-nucleotide diphosphorylase [Kiritimatiellia bacterium]MCO5061212.1 carboxylating nicotinate-nucleotide diphosphorylase [Kiritimatiellia bacterium]